MTDKALDDTLLKRRLLAACEEEMFFAFGSAPKAEDCVIAIDPTRKGKQLLDLIKKHNPKIKMGAWGVSVPGGGATGVPLFRCEKEVPKLRDQFNKLLKAKKLPIKVRIAMEDGSEETEEELPGQGQTLARPAAAAPTGAAQAEPESGDFPPASPQGKATAAFSQLKPKLTEAISADPALAAEIRKHAANFEALVAGGAMGKAREAYQALEGLAALGATAVRESEKAKQTRAVWRETRSHVLGEIEKLRGAIMKEYAQSPMRGEIEAASRRLDRVLGEHDEAIRDRLDAYRDAGARERVGRRSELNRVLAEYRGFIARDPMVAELDDNPFVPVDIRGHLEGRLEALTQQLG